MIYSRAQWGADERLRSGTPKYSATIKTGFVHHTAGTNGYSEAEVPKILRAVYAYHVKGNGWSDIGYNFLVDRFGRLWEGRYGGITKAVIGAHTGGFNVDTFAVSALGNYDKVAAGAADARLDRAADGMEARARTSATPTAPPCSPPRAAERRATPPAPRSPSATSPATVTRGSTSCPGSNLYAQLPTIRALTTSYMGTALYNPRLVRRLSAVYGTGSTVTATARVSSDQQWRLEVRDACRDHRWSGPSPAPRRRRCR